jgi:hypothetical protein
MKSSPIEWLASVSKDLSEASLILHSLHASSCHPTMLAIASHVAGTPLRTKSLSPFDFATTNPIYPYTDVEKSSALESHAGTSFHTGCESLWVQESTSSSSCETQYETFLYRHINTGSKKQNSR